VYQEVIRMPDVAIPTDVSVVGVDDLQLIAAALRPGLTTVALPHAAMGRRAVELAVDQLLERPASGTVERLPGWLVERGSVAPPASVMHS